MARYIFILVFWLLAGEVHAQPAADMVLVGGGKYLPFFSASGDSVEVSSYYLDRKPVTNGEFLEFVREHPKWRRSKIVAVFADENYLRHWNGDLDPGGPRILDAPVTNVSWFAARAYAKWKGKRLPTLHEWEFAALAGSDRPDASKDETFIKKILQWYSRPTPDELPKALSGSPNYYGAYNLHGLVWEWVQDFNTVFISGDSRSDTDTDNKLFCAGAAVGAADIKNYAAFMRFAYRGSLEAAFTVKNLGFRCAKDGNEPS